MHVYTAALVIFCCVVHFWAAVTSAGRRLFNGFRPASPAGKTAGKAASDGPQFDTAGVQETVLGPSVPYPSNQRVMELFEEQVKNQQLWWLWLQRLPSSSHCRREQAAEEVAKQLLGVGVSVGGMAAFILDRSVT